MILQGIAERDSPEKGLLPKQLDQTRYIVPPEGRQIHAIEARVYCENPAAGFKPSPGVLQHVKFPKHDWLRIETWVCWHYQNVSIRFDMDLGRLWDNDQPFF